VKDIYARCKGVWNDIFSKEKVHVPTGWETGNADIDHGLDWLCQGAETVLDFGCGNGSMLFYCALRGTQRHLGIDLSGAGIELAGKRKNLMTVGEYQFQAGDVGKLETVETAWADAAILSNILDNLLPEDAEKLLAETARILKPQGKALIKLNPFLEQAQIQEWNIKVIDGNLLDDGLLLWNLPTGEWLRRFEEFFVLREQRDIWYEKHHQSNRMFLLQKGEEISGG